MLYYSFYSQSSSQPYTYEIISPAAELPLTLEEVKEYLKIDLADNSQDSFLALLIEVVTDYFEEYTGVTLIDTQYRTFRDKFCCNIRLKKSKLRSVDEIRYFDIDNNTVIVSTDVYSNTFETFYSQIFLKQNQKWPTKIGPELQGVQIDFTVGFGPDASFVPTKIKLGLLQHIAMMYENRGDCVLVTSCGCEKYLPSVAKSIYNLFKIRDLSAPEACPHGYL